MSLEIKEVKENTKLADAVRALMEAVFPEDEIISYQLLLEVAKKDGAYFQAFFDENNFCGLAYWLTKDDLVYLLYLAVMPTVQSKGYGTQILNSIKIQNPSKTIMLEAESVRESADNIEQRRRRHKFYECNKFHLQNFRAKEDNTIYDVLAFGHDVTSEELCGLIRHFSPEMADAIVIMD